MIKLLCFAGWTHTLEAKWVDEDYFVHDSFVSLGHFFYDWKKVKDGQFNHLCTYIFF